MQNRLFREFIIFIVVILFTAPIITPITFSQNSIQLDDTPPDVSIISPKPGLYFFNNKIMYLSNIIITIGPIDVVATASDDESGIDHVICEFVRMPTFYYIDIIGEYDHFIFTLNILSLGRWFVTITAYDNAGNSAFDKIEIWKFF